MTVGSFGRMPRGALTAALSAAVILAACGSSPEARPTDPRDILVQAVATTARLTTLRLHIEVVSEMGGGFDGPANGPRMAMSMKMALDVDVDLPTRQLAGRTTVQFPQMGNAIGDPGEQVSEVIVLQAATFTRNGQNGRWMKLPGGAGGAFGGGPTNDQIATMLTEFASNPAVGIEVREASPCTLGTCDHIVAHVAGRDFGRMLGALFGAPVDVANGQIIPDVEVAMLVDQATSVFSEVRTSITMGGTSTGILLTLSNLGQNVQIAAPPPALVDDFGENMGGGFDGGGVGPAPTTILEEVGNELESPWPPSDTESPSAP
jgi:hypothetical protein